MPTIALGNASAAVVGNAIGAHLPRKAKTLVVAEFVSFMVQGLGFWVLHAKEPKR